jgi:transcriptional regulator with XRE-family HTH domain
MTGEDLRQARLNKGWTQQETAAKLGVTQAYLSMLENERRFLSDRLLRRVLKTFVLVPTALPLPSELSQSMLLTGDELARNLGSLGYPGFSYFRCRPKRNPAEVVFAAISSRDLDSRLAESLPWVALRYADMDWNWLVRNAKLADCQNRLGFVVTLARQLAQRARRDEKVAVLSQVEAALERCRLAREDTFAHESLTAAERQWLTQNRPPEAAHWNLLTDLTGEHLAYAA